MTTAEERLLKAIFGETSIEEMNDWLVGIERFDEQDDLDYDLLQLKHYYPHQNQLFQSNSVFSTLLMAAYYRDEAPMQISGG